MSSSSSRPTSKSQKRLLSSAEKERNRALREERWRNIRESYHREHKSDDDVYYNLPVSHPRITVTRTETAGKGVVNTFHIDVQGGDPEDPEPFERTVEGFRTAVGGIIASSIREVMRTSPQVKIQVRLQAEIRKYDEQNNRMTPEQDTYLCSNTLPVHQVEDVSIEIDVAFQQIQEQLDTFNQKGSNWVIHRISKCYLIVDRWVAVRCGSSFIPLPKWLASRRAVINIQNKDEYCFKYAMEAGYSLPKKDPQRVSHYMDRNTFSYKPEDSSVVMKFPFPGHEKVLKEFERINSHLNISINAYFADSFSCHPEHIVILYRTRAIVTPSTKCIDLLLIEDASKNRHWTLIKNFDRLFSLGSDHLTVCRMCLVRMKRSSLENHIKGCQHHAACRVELPDSMDAFASFTKYKKMLEAPFVIYADFEAITSEEKQDSLLNKQSVLRTHIPNAFCFLRVCNFDPKFNGKPVLYRTTADQIERDEKGVIQSDVGEKLIEELSRERDMIFAILKQRLIEGQEMKLTAADEESFQAATECHICKLPFDGGVHPSWKNVEVDSVKVRDHDHLKRKADGSNYRGAAHAWCNLQFHIEFQLVDDEAKQLAAPPVIREDPDEMYSDFDDDTDDEQRQAKRKKQEKKYAYRRFYIPVVFHNLKGYDGHIIIRAINSENVAKSVSTIPQSGEKFLSFSFNNLKFIDSLQFLNSSLASLVDNIRKDDPSGFTYLQSQLEWICARFKVTPSSERLQLLLTKGVYPYDYMDSFDRFSETELPPIEKFKSTLDESDLSEEDYKHAQTIWSKFSIHDMGEYHDLYLLTDVILLADVFQRFRRDAIADTRLDPLHYLSLPGYSLDACYSKCAPVKAKHNRHGPYCIEPFQVEVFNNGLYHKDMHLFCEAAVRGGVSMITGRLGQANHKGLKNYDPSKPSKYIMYVDANNLYGWAMSQYMPIGEYSWVKDLNQFTPDYIQSLSDYGDYGYLLEVDLHIPVDLHNKFKSYPLAPESRPVNESDVSPYTQQLRKRLNAKHDKTPKLLCTLTDKVEYKLHYRNLKLYLSLGYQLKKVHRVLKFRQQPWIRPYIERNTTKRAQATNDFSKDYFKLMNNAVFGKFLQDDRKHRNARLLTRPELIERAISDPFFEDRNILAEDKVIAYMRKKKITMNKPMIVGVCILELSKLHMYNFYYNVMQKIFGENRLRLLFTDTDSLCMEIQTDDFHSEIVKNNAQSYFDWSNYPTDHPMYDKKGKAVLGLFKDETAGFWINQFVGLRSKLYSILKDEKTMMGELLDTGKHLEKKTAKGVKKWIIKKKLRHQQYYDCLTNPEYNPYNHLEQMTGFQTFQNQIYTTQITKLTLSAADDKMFVCDDGITTLPYGYRGITSQTASLCSTTSISTSTLSSASTVYSNSL